MTSGLRRLEGKVVVISGASSGIGAGIARRCLKEGASVVAVARVNLEGLNALTRGHESARIEVMLADVTSEEAGEQVVRKAVETFGGVDVLVNNAGITERRSVTNSREDDWDRVIAVIVTGSYRLTRAALPHMMARGGGSIVNIASVGSLVAWTDEAAYQVAKSALLGLTRSVAVDYAAYGVRANCLCPGLIDAPLLTAWLDSHGARRDDVLGELLHDVPVRRLGTADEVAAAAVFLASEEASYITGTNLLVDGGYTAH